MLQLLFSFAIVCTLSYQINAYTQLGLNGLEIVYQWKYLDWVYPTIKWTGKNFTQGNPLTQDVEVDILNNRVFVTSPHWVQGTPITLSVVTNLKGRGGPLLKPYPNWKWHKPGCDNLVSVYRVVIDKFNRLWVVDNGNIGREPVCPKKILIFDLYTDKVIHKYIVPEDQTFNGLSQLITPIVDDSISCKDAYLFVADVIKHGLLVYSLKENKSWRWNNTAGNAFGFEEDAVDFNIAGEEIKFRDGILGMSLSPVGFFDKRYLYFNSMGSFYEKFVDVNSLKNTALSEPNVYRSLNKRASQAGPQATSKTGAIFFQLTQLTAIACWNIDRPFVPENIVIIAQDEERLQYTSGIKVIVNNLGEEELWFNTNRLQKTIKGTRRMNEINYRVFKGNVSKLIKGTNCEPQKIQHTRPNLNSWKKI